MQSPPAAVSSCLNDVCHKPLASTPTSMITSRSVAVSCLTEAGYQSLASTRLVNGQQFVVARGTARTWHEMLEVFQDVYSPVGLAPNDPHLVIGHFVRKLDDPEVEHQLLRLASARDLMGKRVIACVFVANEEYADFHESLRASRIKSIADEFEIPLFSDELVHLIFRTEATFAELASKDDFQLAAVDDEMEELRRELVALQGAE